MLRPRPCRGRRFAPRDDAVGRRCGLVPIPFPVSGVGIEFPVSPVSETNCATPAPPQCGGRTSPRHQPEGRVAGAEACAVDGPPVIAFQNAVIGLLPVRFGHVVVTSLGGTAPSPGPPVVTHGGSAADAVWELPEQPPRLAKASAAAATNCTFMDHLFLSPKLVSYASATAHLGYAPCCRILSYGTSDVRIPVNPASSARLSASILLVTKRRVPGLISLLQCTQNPYLLHQEIDHHARAWRKMTSRRIHDKSRHRRGLIIRQYGSQSPGANIADDPRLRQ